MRGRFPLAVLQRSFFCKAILFWCIDHRLEELVSLRAAPAALPVGILLPGLLIFPGEMPMSLPNPCR